MCFFLGGRVILLVFFEGIQKHEKVTSEVYVSEQSKHKRGKLNRPTSLRVQREPMSVSVLRLNRLSPEAQKLFMFRLDLRPFRRTQTEASKYHYPLITFTTKYSTTFLMIEVPVRMRCLV